MGPGGAAMLSRGEGTVSNPQVSWSFGGEAGLVWSRTLSLQEVQGTPQPGRIKVCLG